MVFAKADKSRVVYDDWEDKAHLVTSVVSLLILDRKMPELRS
jgi:hypothetical protein